MKMLTVKMLGPVTMGARVFRRGDVVSGREHNIRPLVDSGAAEIHKPEPQAEPKSTRSTKSSKSKSAKAKKSTKATKATKSKAKPVSEDDDDDDDDSDSGAR